MLEAIRIRKMGFPVRRSYQEFAKQYRESMVASGVFDQTSRSKNKDFLKKILSDPKLLKEKTIAFMDKNYQTGVFDKKKNEIAFGYTKVFMKEPVLPVLDKQQEKIIEKSVIKIQAFYKGRLQRRDYLARQEFIKYVQKRLRFAVTYREIKKKAREKLRRKDAATMSMIKEIRDHFAKKKAPPPPPKPEPPAEPQIITVYETKIDESYEDVKRLIKKMKYGELPGEKRSENYNKTMNKADDSEDWVAVQEKISTEYLDLKLLNKQLQTENDSLSTQLRRKDMKIDRHQERVRALHYENTYHWDVLSNNNSYISNSRNNFNSRHTPGRYYY